MNMIAAVLSALVKSKPSRFSGRTVSRLSILLFFAVLACFSCKPLEPQKKENAAAPLHTGKLIALSLDGCAWVIELENESRERLEPMNLHKFDFQPQEGKKVEFAYEPSASSSVCMAGTPVEIKSIRYR